MSPICLKLHIWHGGSVIPFGFIIGEHGQHVPGSDQKTQVSKYPCIPESPASLHVLWRNAFLFFHSLLFLTLVGVRHPAPAHISASMFYLSAETGLKIPDTRLIHDLLQLPIWLVRFRLFMRLFIVQYLLLLRLALYCSHYVAQDVVIISAVVIVLSAPPSWCTMYRIDN